MCGVCGVVGPLLGGSCAGTGVVMGEDIVEVLEPLGGVLEV